ncbi:hypothetical protein ACOSQ4_004712 [Xanthoceras sorbifolium]
MLDMVHFCNLIDGLNVFYKLAANDGMSLQVIIAYRFIFATTSMIPLALFLESQILLCFVFYANSNIICELLR